MRAWALSLLAVCVLDACSSPLGHPSGPRALVTGSACVAPPLDPAFTPQSHPGHGLPGVLSSDAGAVTQNEADTQVWYVAALSRAGWLRLDIPLNIYAPGDANIAAWHYGCKNDELQALTIWYAQPAPGLPGSLRIDILHWQTGKPSSVSSLPAYPHWRFLRSFSGTGIFATLDAPAKVNAFYRAYQSKTYAYTGEYVGLPALGYPHGATVSTCVMLVLPDPWPHGASLVEPLCAISPA